MGGWMASSSRSPSVWPLILRGPALSFRTAGQLGSVKGGPGACPWSSPSGQQTRITTANIELAEAKDRVSSVSEGGSRASIEYGQLGPLGATEEQRGWVFTPSLQCWDP